ncbi:hypothetical protein EIP86_009807 [Pleurotus ostreatoroseus]|nr:hypothetical protein EIP86_009807 [Pleurotus ostreatoroseus]
MHFGPEWMRTRQAPSRPNPSPPLATPAAGSAPAGASTYSALVTPAAHPPAEKRDLSNPFRYSKDDMLRIYKEGGGKGGLGLEVERWEGIVREVGSDPISMKELNEAEKKLTLPRKLSQSSLQPPLASPRDALPSPRTRIGGATGFDGVLSDSWSVKRRASEGFLKGTARAGDPPDAQSDPKADGIKEEEEEHPAGGQSGGGATTEASDGNAVPASPGAGRVRQPPQDVGIGGVPNLSLNTRLQNQPIHGAIVGTPIEQPPAGPPPGLVDVNTIEWQYLDPQGHIQGPFPSTTMQKWYDEGYFTPNLLMRRTNIDKDWVPVGDLLQIAASTRIFLTPLNIPLTSGLPRRDPLLDGPSNGFGSPFQPVPNRSVLDAYHNGAVAPESPASGFTGRFSNESPEPSLYGNRIGGHLFNDSALGSRLAPFPGLSHGVDPQRRATMEESLNPSLSRPTYSGFGPGRANSVDGLGFNGVDQGPTGSVDPGSPFSSGFPSTVTDPNIAGKAPFNGTRGVVGNGHASTPSFASSDFASPGFINGREGPRLLNRDIFGERAELQQNLGGQFVNGGLGYQQTNQAFGAGQPMPYPSQSDTRSVHSISSIPERQAVGTPLETRSQQSFPSPSQSPWNVQEAPIRRPGPFDPDYPTSRNTVVVPAQRPIAPAQPVQPPRPAPAAASSEQSPWFAASQGIVSNAWASDPNSLTAANLGQHNRQQEQEELKKQQQVQPASAAKSPIAAEQVTSQEALPKQRATPESAAPADVQPPKSRRKPSVNTPAAVGAASVPQAQSAKVPVASSAPAKPPSPTQGAASDGKHAWAIDEDKKTKTPGPALGLREIQEMEAKKLEAKKVAERERERAARAASAVASPSSEEVQTISWGLPTSQVGVRAAALGTKEAPAVSPSQSSQPNTPALVWTGVSKAPAAKKTMKEIQEEEEKRKKMTKEKETVASAARRAYAESTNKVATQAQVGGAWTTVGASGKTNVATAAAARPASASSAPAKASSAAAAPTTPSTASAVARNGNAAPSRPSAVPAPIKLAPTPKVDDMPAAPSHDFLKWLTDSLKGLNSTVNMEEITSMLLSFPLDPDSSTLELISDLIYANSTTLDGRRFASEFVNKRKVDAKSSSSNGAGKTLSIADVVKAQPKPAQNEWGGFKVVNKKKKGTRS